MKVYKPLLIFVLLALILGACSAAPKEISDVQTTLEALSIQATIDRSVQETMQASDAGSNPVATTAPTAPGDDDSALGDAPNRTACNSYTTLELVQQDTALILQNQNYAPLVQSGILSDPVRVGFWQSEGTNYSALEMTQNLETNWTPGSFGPFTITFDPALFPATDGGGDWIDMFGPSSVGIGYSTGWGSDGLGEAILYFEQDTCGGYVWSGMLYSFFGLAPATLGPPPSCSSYISILDFETALIDTLDSRNFNDLLINGMMSDPINVGFWQSEGVSLTPIDMVDQLTLNYLPAINSTPFYATNDTTLFPPDGGFAWSNYGGPDTIALIYTEGWGTDGKGQAFLFLADDNCGGIVWHGMIYAGSGFTP